MTSNTFTGMTDFTGQCKYDPCLPLLPQFLMKPTDQTIRLNIQKVLKLEIFHPTMTDYYLRSSSETISLLVINDPPFLHSEPLDLKKSR